jgi:long-subunit acyl-CoA synthetase (AMP-forming)
MFGHVNGDSIKWQTFDEIFQKTIAVLLGLSTIFSKLPKSAEPHMIAICASNSTEWFILDFACIFGKHISVPIHHTFTIEELQRIYEQIKPKIFV